MLAIFSKAIMLGVIISTNEFLRSNSFIYREFRCVVIVNILHKNLLCSSYPFYHFSFSFYEYLFFINRVFHNIFNVTSVTSIFNNDLYTIYLFLIMIYT